MAQLAEVTVSFNGSMFLLGVHAFLDVLKASQMICPRDVAGTAFSRGFISSDSSSNVLKKALGEDKMPVG